MCCNGICCGKCHFCRLFLSQVFDFGYSCGSLISAALGIFRTFQRLSATISFRTKFSPECLGKFSWAFDIIKIFSSIIETNPMSDYDNFNLYTLIIPITIIVYFTFIATDILIIFHFYGIIGLCIMFGAGIGFIGVNGVIAGLLIPIPIVIVLIMYCCYCCDSGCNCDCCFSLNVGGKNIKEKLKKFDELVNEGLECENFYVGLAPTIFLFYVLMIPIMLGRSQLIKVLSTFIGVLVGLLIIIYFMYSCWLEEYNFNWNFQKVGDKIINFLTNILTLLIIPSTNYFVLLMKSKYSNDWRCILSYLILSLLFPLLLTLFNIIGEHDSITGKYKNNINFFYYVELIDIFRQLLYAIMAGYDFIWVCLFIDIVWAIFIGVFRPYVYKSEYFLNWGNCLVTVIINSVIIHADSNHIEKLSFDAAIAFVVLACLPAIVAMYVFFSLDFNVDANSLDKQEAKINGFNLIFAFIITPVSWFLFGINLPLIDGKIYKPDI